ncbi:PilZ domain-containing protein [bacterium]|nr:PilZ domain-containing protein [bacterium]
MPPLARRSRETSGLQEMVNYAADRLALLRLQNLRESLADVENILRSLKDELEVRRQEGRSVKLTEQLVWEAEQERARLLGQISAAVEVPGIYSERRRRYETEESFERITDPRTRITQHFAQFHPSSEEFTREDHVPVGDRARYYRDQDYEDDSPYYYSRSQEAPSFELSSGGRSLKESQPRSSETPSWMSVRVERKTRTPQPASELRLDGDGPRKAPTRSRPKPEPLQLGRPDPSPKSAPAKPKPAGGLAWLEGAARRASARPRMLEPLEVTAEDLPAIPEDDELLLQDDALLDLDLGDDELGDLEVADLALDEVEDFDLGDLDLDENELLALEELDLGLDEAEADLVDDELAEPFLDDLDLELEDDLELAPAVENAVDDLSEDYDELEALAEQPVAELAEAEEIELDDLDDLDDYGLSAIDFEVEDEEPGDLGSLAEIDLDNLDFDALDLDELEPGEVEMTESVIEPAVTIEEPIAIGPPVEVEDVDTTDYDYDYDSEGLLDPPVDPVEESIVPDAPSEVEEPVIDASLSEVEELIEEPIIDEAPSEIEELIEEPVIDEALAEVEEPIIDAAPSELEKVIEEPVIDEAPAEVEEPIEEPIVDEAPAEVEELIEEPIVDEAPAEPEELVEEPVIDEAPAELEELIEEPIIDEAPSELEEVIEEPIIDEAPSELEEVIEEPAVQEAPAEPGDELSELNGPAELSGPADLFEGPDLTVTEPVSVEPVTEAVVEEDLFAGPPSLEPVQNDDLFASSEPLAVETVGPASLEDGLLGGSSEGIDSGDFFAGPASVETSWLDEEPAVAPSAELQSAVSEATVEPVQGTSLEDVIEEVAAQEAVAAPPPAAVEAPPAPSQESGASAQERRRLVRLACDFDTSAYLEGRPVTVKLVDISLGGGKLRGPQSSFQRGQLIQVSNPLPEARVNEPVTARIVWMRASRDEEGKYDIGLQFEESPEVLGKSWVITVLNKIGMQSKVFNQRKYTRAVANLPIEIDLKTKERTPGTALDIGLGGALLAVNRPLSPTTRFTLHMGPLGNHAKLELNCEVISSRLDEGGIGWTHSAKFAEISTTQTKLLGKYVVDLLKAGGSV